MSTTRGKRRVVKRGLVQSLNLTLMDCPLEVRRAVRAARRPGDHVVVERVDLVRLVNVPVHHPGVTR